MQIVIDIPEKDYNNIEPFLNGQTIKGGFNLFKVLEIIKNGVPLPKGHGDLIDRNKIEYLKALHDLKWNKITASECATKIKYSAPTIITGNESEESE